MTITQVDPRYGPALQASIETRWKLLATGAQLHEVPSCELCKVADAINKETDGQSRCAGCPLYIVQGCTCSDKSSAYIKFYDAYGDIEELSLEGAREVLSLLEQSLTRFFPEMVEKSIVLKAMILKGSDDKNLSHTSYYFQSIQECKDWQALNSPTVGFITELPGLTVGDKCIIKGVAYNITDIVMTEPHKFLFCISEREGAEVIFIEPRNCSAYPETLKVDPRYEEALTKSIELRWKPIAAGVDPKDVPNCHLCKLDSELSKVYEEVPDDEYPEECTTCPLYILGDVCREGSTYMAWRSADHKTKKARAHDMINALVRYKQILFPT